MKILFQIKYYGLAAAFALTVIITGCKTSTFYSREYNIALPDTNIVKKCDADEGLAYFLPKGYIHLVAELQNAATSKSPQVGLSSITDKSASSSESNLSTTVNTNVSPIVETNKQTISSQPYYKVTIDVILEPDADHMFLLKPQISAWAHDTYGISVQNGLLASIGATNADQTGGVFLKVAELAGLVVSMSGAPETITNTPLRSSLPTKFELIIDPESYASEQGQLNQYGNLILKIRPNFESAERARFAVAVNGKMDAGIFYRPLLPYTVTVTDRNNHGAQYQTIVLLPNKSPILSLVPRRSMLVTAKTSIIFDKGCPTGMSFDRDSPALAWFSLPVDMIKAFLAAPAELVQLKFNFANTNTQLSSQQLTELNNQLAILKDQAAIHQFMLTNSVSKNH